MTSSIILNILQDISKFEDVHHGDGLVGPHLGDCDGRVLIVVPANCMVKGNRIMKTSFGTGFGSSIPEHALAVVGVCMLESTYRASFRFTQDTYDFSLREFRGTTIFSEGIMLIFESFECA